MFKRFALSHSDLCCSSESHSQTLLNGSAQTFTQLTSNNLSSKKLSVMCITSALIFTSSCLLNMPQAKAEGLLSGQNIGIASGAVAGGVLGNQLGGKKNKALGTVAGVVGGAVVGGALGSAVGGK